MSSSQPEGSLASIDIAVLAGGLGTRLRPVLGGTPKILAPIGGRPFFDHLLTWLTRFGARRVVLCLGVGADPVLAHIASHPLSGLEIVPSLETEPLGTAGALRLALPHLRSDPVLVMNGDTFVDADLAEFVAAHRQHRAAASILAATVPSTARYGRLDIDEAGFIRCFREKDPTDTRPGPINAGLYLFSPAWLAGFARSTGPSLERDVFAAAAPGTFRAVAATGSTFLDFGTPESYQEAEQVIDRALGRQSTAGGVRNPAVRGAA